MNSADRDLAYRAASQAAQAEMKSILNEMEQLQQRRTQIERISEALRPLVEPEQQFAPADQHADSPFEPSYQAAPRVLPELSSDPLQRQINYALGNVAVA